MWTWKCESESVKASPTNIYSHPKIVLEFTDNSTKYLKWISSPLKKVLTENAKQILLSSTFCQKLHLSYMILKLHFETGNTYYELHKFYTHSFWIYSVWVELVRICPFGEKEYSWFINYSPASREHRLIFINPGQDNYLRQLNVIFQKRLWHFLGPWQLWQLVFASV